MCYWFLYQNQFTMSESTVLPLYYINLKRSKDRKKQFETMIQEEQERLGNKIVLDVTRVEAVDGQREDLASFFKGSVDNGEAACLVSHINVAKEIVKNGHDVALICEDDAFLNFSWNPELFLAQMNNRPKDLKLWQIGVNAEKIQEGEFVPYAGGTFSTCCYMLTKEGAKRIASLLDQKRDFRTCDLMLCHVVKTYYSGFPWARWIPGQVSTIHPSHDGNNTRMLKNSIFWLEKVHGKNGLERCLNFL